MRRYRVEVILDERSDCEPFETITEVAQFVLYQVNQGRFVNGRSALATEIVEEQP